MIVLSLKDSNYTPQQGEEVVECEIDDAGTTMLFLYTPSEKTAMRAILKGQAYPTLNNPEDVYFFANGIIEGRWPEGENAILKSNDPGLVVLYANDVIKGPWPEAEPIIRQQEFWWDHYKKHVVNRPGRIRYGRVGNRFIQVRP